MAIIGFTDQTDRPEKNEKELTQEQIAKFENNLQAGMDSLYLSDKQLAQMESTYGTVVVHDFNDEYHLTDEERAEINAYYKLFARLNCCKRKYRKIDEFVDCARISLECLDAVAENNTVYEPDEFKSLVLKGKLYVSGWFFPEYKGRDRKQLSWEYITEFIMSDTPSNELLKTRTDTLATEEELENLRGELFDKDELDRILAPMDSETDHREHYRFFDKDVDRVEVGSTITVISDEKETKSLIKAAPELLLLAKDIKRELKSSYQIDRFVSDVRMDDIERIEEYDNAMSFVSDSDVPEFTGDVTNSKDYHRYLRALDLYEKTQIRENYNGKMRTKEEIQEIQLKDALESAGWNIRVLYDNKLKEKKLKRALKADQKREKQLKRQLTRVRTRSERRMGTYQEDNKKKKSKKKKKRKDDD